MHACFAPLKPMNFDRGRHFFFLKRLFIFRLAFAPGKCARVRQKERLFCFILFCKFVALITLRTTALILCYLKGMGPEATDAPEAAGGDEKVGGGGGGGDGCGAATGAGAGAGTGT